MTDDTTSTELTERLAALGRHPVDPATASQHLSAMAGVSLGRTGLRQKLQVAGALMAGIFIGGTGLATAGALGQSAEHRADKFVDAVTGQDDDGEKKNKAGKDKDDADDTKADADAAKTDSASTDNGRKCPEGQNHGQAVRTAAQKDNATGESVSTVAKSDACAAKPADGSTTGTEKAEDKKPADKPDNSGKGSENSGQGSTKSVDGQEKADDARDARPQNSGTGGSTTGGTGGTTTGAVELDDDDDESDGRGSGRSGSGSGNSGKGKPAELPTP